MITPAQMPKKVNPLHQQILGELLSPRKTTRTEIHWKRGVPTKVDVPVPTLAGNVSEHNVNRMAARWMP